MLCRSSRGVHRTGAWLLDSGSGWCECSRRRNGGCVGVWRRRVRGERGGERASSAHCEAGSHEARLAFVAVVAIMMTAVPPASVTTISSTAAPSKGSVSSPGGAARARTGLTASLQQVLSLEGIAVAERRGCAAGAGPRRQHIAAARPIARPSWRPLSLGTALYVEI
eukprot:scaffold1781_cov416-Prasinococcus_capsulatus_cf.AAC.2